MILSLGVVDTVFRGSNIPDNVAKIYYAKDGTFPTSYMLGVIGRSGERRSTPLYNCWCNMRQRCLEGSDQQNKIKAYKGSFCDFKSYQEFAEFCHQLPFFKSKDIKGNPYEIDKDIKGFILKKVNVYSADTLCAIPKDINCFLTCVQLHNGSTKRSTKGVIQSVGKSYQLRLQDVCGDGKRKVFSKHNTYQEAYKELKAVKYNQAKFLANKFKGSVDDIVIDFLNNFDLDEWTEWTYFKRGVDN